MSAEDLHGESVDRPAVGRTAPDARVVSRGRNALLWAAVIMVVIGYGLEFGYGATRSLFSSAGEPSHDLPVSQIIARQAPLWQAGLLCALLACGLIGIAAALKTPQADGFSQLRTALRAGLARPWMGERDAPPGTGLITLGAVWVSLLAGYLAVTALQHLGVLPPTTNPWPAMGLTDGLRLGVIAATGEEPLVLILPVLLWHQIRGRTMDGWAKAFTVVLVAARIYYHLYYGPGALAMLPWAITVVILFWRWRQSWALLLGHFSYYLNNASHTWWMPWLMLAIGSSVIAAGIWRNHHDTPSDRTGHSRSLM